MHHEKLGGNCQCPIELYGEAIISGEDIEAI